MNPNWSDASNWLDIVDHVWIGVVVIAAAGVPSWFAARNHRSLTEVKEQVKNQHATNLRDDIDRAIHAIETIGRDVRVLRSDLLAEQDSRRAQISDLRDELEHRTGKHRRL